MDLAYSNRNLFRLYDELSGIAQSPVKDVGGVSLVDIPNSAWPSQLFNPVFEKQELQERLDYLRRKSVTDGWPNILMASPDTDAAVLSAMDEAVPNRGNWTAMSMGLERPITSKPAEGIVLQQVTIHPGLQDWAEIVRVALMGGAGLSMSVFGLLAQQAHAGFFVGYIKDVPVASALAYVYEGSLGIYLIATLPAYRRKGIGRWITEQAMNWGIAQGATEAHLQATDAGRPVYEVIGFKTKGNIPVYRL